MKNRQVKLFILFLMVYVFITFLTYALGLQDQAVPGATTPEEYSSIPGWLLGLSIGLIVMVFYGLAGLGGLWFANRLELPGIYNKATGWKNWFLIPMLIGLCTGILMILFDRLFAASANWNGFTHPPFPLSLLASASAGIGEEIIFRMFILGLWAFLFNLLLKRWQLTPIALWAGNILAALAFAAGHLPSAMYLLNVNDPSLLPGNVLAEVFLLNGIVGLVAGERYMKQGFVAAAGVHFWADILWHVIFPPLLACL